MSGRQPKPDPTGDLRRLMLAQLEEGIGLYSGVLDERRRPGIAPDDRREVTGWASKGAPAGFRDEGKS